MNAPNSLRSPVLYRPRNLHNVRWAATMIEDSIESDTVLWLLGNRPSTLGGYIGRFCVAKVENGHYYRSLVPSIWECHMSHVEPLPGVWMPVKW